MSFMVPLSISVAGGIIVGNSLGEGRPIFAKQVAHTTIGTILSLALCNATFIFFLQNFIPRAFTDDDFVRKAFGGLVWLLIPVTILDALQNGLGGVLRGLGLTTWGTISNLLGYYIFSIPIAVVLVVVVHLKLEGIWMAMIIGLLVICISQLIGIGIADFALLSQKAIARSVE